MFIYIVKKDFTRHWRSRLSGPSCFAPELYVRWRIKAVRAAYAGLLDHSNAHWSQRDHNPHYNW
jgi:hypothetical protein